MARCSSCNKFQVPEYNGDYNEQTLEISDDGVVSASYDFTLGCTECGGDMLTTTIDLENNDATEGVAAFLALDEAITEEQINKAREDARMTFLGNLGVEGEEDLDDIQRESMESDIEAAETALTEHDFQLEETNFEVTEDRVGTKKVWVVELQVMITDSKHPNWEGEEITLKDSIYQSEMDEV
jgi:hypothetical protein